MLTKVSAKYAFTLAILLLVVCGVLIYGTLANFADSERRVEHSQHVRELLGETESDIASAARLRLVYVFNGDNTSLTEYRNAVEEIRAVLKQLREITVDNPVQQTNCDRLETAVNTRIQVWEKSVALRQSGAPEAAGQPQMTLQSLEFANDIVSVTRAMDNEEAVLLKQRNASARAHFFTLIIAVALTLAAAVLLLLWHYRLLRTELEARAEAERSASEAAEAATQLEKKAYQAERAALASHEAARRLSARLLELRDDERRRLSRELHDSIGQYLAAIKMNLAVLAPADAPDHRYSECVKLLDQSIKEVRTISHLLHPPGLDEAGFSSAARWYAEEFAKRSGLSLKLNIEEPPGRLSPAMELALFRVLQESLTNIHRHSKSNSAEISFEVGPEHASLVVADYGSGIPEEVLKRFQVSGTSGVGLAGMRERIRELGGRFEVESASGGTRVRVSVPLSESKSVLTQSASIATT
ncbi:MAG TPA: CHASE3 domain-containing protein [Terriglobales bacterium]|jgi:signal transduction histidine kinase